jgi:flagellin-like hook-associated protein FlgL
MKVSTSYLFDRATERMSKLQNQLATTQAQMSVSKQILSPSDAPDQAAAIQRLKGARCRSRCVATPPRKLPSNRATTFWCA